MYELVVVNGGVSPYTGTVVTGVPLDPKVIHGPIPISARLEDGQVLRASHLPLSRHRDGSIHWMQTMVTGTFQPGETKVTVEPAIYDPSIRSTFVPTHWDWFMRSTIEVEYTLFNTQPASSVYRLPLVDLVRGIHGSTIHQATNNLILVEHFGEITPKVGWRLFYEARAGEPGVRYEFQLESRGPGLDDGGKPIILKRLELHHDQGAPVTNLNIPYGRPLASDRAQLGEITVIFGKETAPISIWHEGGPTVVSFVGPSSYIPQGGRYALPALPGGSRNPNDSNQWPESDLGLFVYEKLAVQFFLGDDVPQEHLDCPPMLLWADPAAYDRHILGGVTIPAGDQASSTAGRYDRMAQSYVDPEECDPQAGERITARTFIERGGTYPKSAGDNPHYGVRNWGDRTWGDGHAGGLHYNILDSTIGEFLRTQDPRWWYEAHVGGRHFRVWDFTWSSDPGAQDTRMRFEGYAVYEKGHHHGNYGIPNVSHCWLGGIALAYVMTGHPEYKRICQQAAHAMSINDTFDGMPVPASWVVGSGHDPRDWGSPAGRAHLYGSSTGSATGYQGDGGIRRPGRVLTMLAHFKHYLGSEIATDLVSASRRVLKNVERVETGIWGGKGYILNRLSRTNHSYDYDQGWMLGYLTRGAGTALQVMPELKDDYGALYDRMLRYLAGLVVYGHVDSNGQVVPPRLSYTFDASGATTVTRPGITKTTENLWYKWRGALNNVTACTAWVAALDQNVQDLKNYVHPTGESAWILADPGFNAYVMAADSLGARITSGETITDTDPEYVLVLKEQWKWLDQVYVPNMNHCSIGADALAQAYLVHGKTDQTIWDSAIRLLENVSWHLDLGSSVKGFSDIRTKPSPVSYRLGMYPNSESKIMGALRETRYARKLLAGMDGDVWDPSLSPAPQVALTDVAASMISASVHVALDEAAASLA